MKNYFNKSNFLKTLLTVAILSSPFTSQAESLVNLGTLDVKPVAGGQYINLDLNAGQPVQQQIQVSNFSADPMNLQIYVADAAENSENNFIANNKNQLSEDLYPWVTLPVNNLSLASGESKILSVNIASPANAGVGMHTGAIMVSQKIAGNQNNLSLEKGIRIYANIKGTASPNMEMGSSTLNESGRFLNYSNTVTNTGNTDLKGNVSLNLYDQSNQLVGTQTQSVYLKPQTSEVFDLAVEKPAFGLYHATLSNDILKPQQTELGTKLLLPSFALPLAAILAIGALALLAFSKRKSLQFSLPRIKIPKFDLSALNRQMALQRAGAFFGLVMVVSIVAFNSGSFSGNIFKADLLGNSNSYLTTIRLGNLENKTLPEKLRTDWQGNIKFENATISINEKLNQEKTDQFFTNSDQNTLYFKNTTGPDNDGVVVLVTPLSSLPVTATYKNTLTTEEIAFPLDATIKTTKLFDFKAHQISINSAVSNAIAEVETISDNSATEEISDIESTEEIGPDLMDNPELAGQIKILQEVISDLPASAETLSSYILNSNYVQEVSSENQITTVTADPALIAALQDAPDTITDITSTEELNFLFVPDEKIRFTPQSFSFKETKTVTQDLGRIVFVQNRESDWNTYISVTDLVSVSGKGSIQASNINVDPGQVKILSGEAANSTIEAGPSRKLSGSGDPSLLANISPVNSEQIVFSLNPKLSITVPASTSPGTYRGQISIKVL